jgi:hypothetical protein
VFAPRRDILPIGKRISEEVNMPGRARFVTLLAAATVAVVWLGVLAVSASAAETKTFTGQKDCTAVSPPAPGGYCLITESSLKILRGAKVYYTDAHIVAGVLMSPVTLRAIDERESTATGQCTYYRLAVPKHGLCTYSGGTGKLDGFHASVLVSAPIRAGVFALAGTYWFDHDE